MPGVENPAADYLSRLDINPEDRIHLKLNDQIPVHYTHPNHVNFASTFFQKLGKNRKRLEVVNKALYRKFFDNTGRVLFKQIVVPPETYSTSKTCSTKIVAKQPLQLKVMRTFHANVLHYTTNNDFL